MSRAIDVVATFLIGQRDLTLIKVISLPLGLVCACQHLWLHPDKIILKYHWLKYKRLLGQGLSHEQCISSNVHLRSPFQPQKFKKKKKAEVCKWTLTSSATAS